MKRLHDAEQFNSTTVQRHLQTLLKAFRSLRTHVLVNFPSHYSRAPSESVSSRRRKSDTLLHFSLAFWAINCATLCCEVGKATTETGIWFSTAWDANLFTFNLILDLWAGGRRNLNFLLTWCKALLAKAIPARRQRLNGFSLLCRNVSPNCKVYFIVCCFQLAHRYRNKSLT